MASLFDQYEILARSGLFDAAYYSETGPELLPENIDPLLHYIEHGARAGRNPCSSFDTAFYMEQCRKIGDLPENPLLHFVTRGAVQGLKPQRDDAQPAKSNGAGARQKAASEHPIPIVLNVDLLSAKTDRGQPSLVVQGWAIAGSPIAEISAMIGGNIVGYAAYGLDRPDVAQRFPLHPNAALSGFNLTIDQIPEQTQGETQLTLMARAVSGEVLERSFIVHIESGDSDGAKVRARHLHAPSASDPPMRLQVDSASVDGRGVLKVDGWVVCLVQVASVEIYVDDVRIGTAAFGMVRDDVADTFSSYPNARFSGFSLLADVTALGGGKKTVRVQAQARTGIVREVRIPVDMKSFPRKATHIDVGTFYFHCDEIELTTSGSLALTGWAVCATPTKAVEVPLPVQAVLPPAAIEADKPQHLINTERLKFYLDFPRLVGGVAETPVRNSLAISGWALARAGVERIDVAIDAVHVNTAYYGTARRDVAAACPDWDNALLSGFNALIPPKALPNGRHVVTLTISDKRDNTAVIEFFIDVEQSVGDGPWSLRRKLSQSQVALYEQILIGLKWRPAFTFLLVVGSGSESAIPLARGTLAILRNQPYAEWRVLVLPQGRGIGREKLRERLVDGFEDIADRIEVLAAKDKRTLADIASSAKPPSSRTLFAVLIAGDELGLDSLYEFALASGLDRKADFIYGDDRRINPATESMDAFFKPEWSPDLLLSCNYIGRAWCATTDLLSRTGATLKDMLSFGAYDLVLRCTEAAGGIKRIPAVLHQHSAVGLDADIAERRALTRAIQRRGSCGRIVRGCKPGFYRLRRDVVTRGRVSIIIPTCASRGLIRPCIETLRKLTAYRDFEIVCIENIPASDRKWKTWLRANADKVIETTEPFNWSRFNNLAAAKADGDFFLFLNDDIEIIDPHWLDALLEHAQRPEVGAVGSLLLYPDHRIQHAGMFLISTGQARHAFRFGQEDDPGYFGLALSQRNVIGVTGACLLTRRETFERLGRFNEAHSVINNDLDYCLRTWRDGLVNIYTPHAKLIHHEFASRATVDEKFDTRAFARKWHSTFAHGDPYHHPSLSRDHDDFVPEREPLQVISAGHPLLARESIRKILVVKLDHIGDCVIALPALHRLKLLFPKARISVLAARATRMVWAQEADLDEIIEFDFYHARSGLGKRDVTEEELLQLRRQLEDKHFDLAVDLRKNPDARHVLQYTGAPYLVGFDYQGRFPFLDIALEWEGDPGFGGKRQHVGDDLINLVETIGTACDTDRSVMNRPTGGIPTALGQTGRKLFRRRVVCIHPAVGTVMRQWPPEHFAELIDLLIEESQVHVALIGGPDEEDVAKSVLERVRNTRSVWNMIGKFKLSELPAFLSACALFVGNNSGPQHIAAGIGVPTIGIHSGVVDAREWGPVGPIAIALRRDMVCSPCYFEKPEDCSRGLACLQGLRPGDVYRNCVALLQAGSVAS